MTSEPFDPAALALPSPRNAELHEIFAAASEDARRGAPGELASVIAIFGSTPSSPGQKLYLGDLGVCLGTVGGGAVERAVLETMAARVGKGEGPVTRTFSLGAELGMCCGGRVEVLFESFDGAAPCLLVGGGHVATATAPLLASLGFAVTVVDEREEWGSEGRIPNARVVCGEFDDVGRTITRRAIVLAMTHDHALDQRVIEWAIRERFAFVGGVGSRAKAKRVRDRMAHKGVPEESLDAIRMPIGLSIGARTPMEIAVSIAAELVQWRSNHAKTSARTPANRPAHAHDEGHHDDLRQVDERADRDGVVRNA